MSNLLSCLHLVLSVAYRYWGGGHYEEGSFRCANSARQCTLGVYAGSNPSSNTHTHTHTHTHTYTQMKTFLWDFVGFFSMGTCGRVELTHFKEGYHDIRRL